MQGEDPHVDPPKCYDRSEQNAGVYGILLSKALHCGIDLSIPLLPVLDTENHVVESSGRVRFEVFPIFFLFSHFITPFGGLCSDAASRSAEIEFKGTVFLY